MSQHRRSLDGTVTAQKLGAIARQSARPDVHVHEGNLLREVRRERIACQQGAGFVIDLSANVQGRLIAHAAENPFGIVGGRQPPRPATGVP